MAKGKGADGALDGQVAIVTGGGRGVGRAVALALAARGVRVVVTGRSERDLGEAVGEIVFGGGKARHIAGDVRDPVHAQAAVEKALEAFGSVDIVVCAARSSDAARIGGDLARAEAIVQTNVMGTYYVFDAALRAMKGPGCLIAITAPGEGAACAASHDAVLGLVRAVAEETAPRRITCNAIARSSADEDSVADLAVLLCSDAAAGITGQALVARPRER